MTFSQKFLNETAQICNSLDGEKIEAATKVLSELNTNGGRLYILGCGGSAGHASHAVNDFRKICGINAFSPTDNVSELTARINDDGWDTVFCEWLKVSRFCSKDKLLIFSVGGGSIEKQLSVNLIEAIKLSKEIGAQSICIVGKSDGFAAKNCDVSLVVPIANSNHVTPHAEAFAAVIWHLMVSHPLLKAKNTTWESVDG